MVTNPIIVGRTECLDILIKANSSINCADKKVSQLPLVLILQMILYIIIYVAIIYHKLELSTLYVQLFQKTLEWNCTIQCAVFSIYFEIAVYTYFRIQLYMTYFMLVIVAIYSSSCRCRWWTINNTKKTSRRRSWCKSKRLCRW